MMNDDIEKVLFSQEDIKRRTRELGEQITRDYAGRDIVCLGILRGCFMFMADIVRSIDLNCTVDFMAVSSYGNGTSTTGAVKIGKDISESIEGKHVIIIEDIIDSGHTLVYLKKYLSGMKPASLAVCTLFDKPSRREVEMNVEYVGFECPNEFIVGYGLDYAQYYRNLPYIGVLKPEVYEK